MIFVSRSSDERLLASRRAAAEPLAALVAVLVVGAALGLHAAALDEATPGQQTRTADLVTDRIEQTITVGGVARPARLTEVTADRRVVAVELTADGETWRVEPSGGDEAGATSPEERSETVLKRRVTVDVAPGEVDPGVLRVVIRA